MPEFDQLKDIIYEGEKIINWDFIEIDGEPLRIYYKLTEIDGEKGRYGFILMVIEIAGDLTQDREGNYSFHADQEIDYILRARANYSQIDKIWFEDELDYPDTDRIIKILLAMEELAKKFCGGYDY